MSLSLAEADALLGKTGTVRNPSKGVWPRTYRVVGYDPSPENAREIVSLKLESVERVAARPVLDNRGQPTGEVIPEHPEVVTYDTPANWFRPDDAPTAA